MNIYNTVLPKECLLEDPWDLNPPDRDTWVNCAYLRSTYATYVNVIAILIVTIILCIVLYFKGEIMQLAIVCVIGTILLMAVLKNPWWESTKAGMVFDKFKMEWDTELKVNNGDVQKTREIFINRKLKEREIGAYSNIAGALFGLRPTVPGRFGSINSYNPQYNSPRYL